MIGTSKVNGTVKKVVLLGGTGFAGKHMARLLRPNHEVFAYGREIDIRDKSLIQKVLSQHTPDWVVNFASVTTVRESFADPVMTYEIGFLGNLNLITMLQEIGFSGRLLNISSSEVYGHPMPKELPLSESSELRPMSPYAVSKLAAEFLCYQSNCSVQFDILSARPFTHIGPGQSDRFAVSNFARQIAEVDLGSREPVIRVGDLSTTRDFTDVRDVVRAYWLLLESGKTGEVYNVCSGMETSLLNVLERLVAKSRRVIRVEMDETMLRNAEQKRLYGSYDKLNQDTGWHPEIELEKTLADTLGYWLHELK